MDALGLIQEQRKLFVLLKEKKQSVISIEVLEKYLENMEPLANAANNVAAQQIARQKFEDDMEVWKARSAYDLAMFNSVIEAGMNALKSAIIINGGAAVALLAFIGGLSEKHTFILSDVGFSLLMFMFGTGCAGTASGIRYLAQFFYARAQDAYYGKNACAGKAWNLGGTVFNLFCISLAVASYILFFYGGWNAYIAVIK